MRAKLIQVDGTGSNVDADKLDGIEAAEFVRTAQHVLDRLRTIDGAGSGVDADLFEATTNATTIGATIVVTAAAIVIPSAFAIATDSNIAIAIVSAPTPADGYL